MLWPLIQKGDIVDILAPSGKIEPENISLIRALVENLGLTPRISDRLLGDHPFCANTDEERYTQLKNALEASDSSLIWCVRGGYGTTRILPELIKLAKPARQKLLVGFSDITSLHLWLNQDWGWPTLHGMMARQAACRPHNKNDFNALLNIWFNGIDDYRIDHLQPLNEAAHSNSKLSGITIGTNASLIQSSLGTPWQIDAKDKIIFLEDINEAPYRLERLFIHLANAGVFDQARAIVFGDFGEDLPPKMNHDYQYLLEEFSRKYLANKGIEIPIFRLEGFGHCARNKPIPLGVYAEITHYVVRFTTHLLDER